MRWGVVKPQSLGPPVSPLLPSLPLPYPPLRPPAPVPPPQLDKHNERRRKAEAEQKARMMDSGSDSPGASGRGTKEDTQRKGDTEAAKPTSSSADPSHDTLFLKPAQEIQAKR